MPHVDALVIIPPLPIIAYQTPGAVLSVPQKPTSSNVAKVVSPVVMDQGKGANRAFKAVNEDIVSYANT